MTVRGGCLCGSVAFEVDLPFVKFVKCHCSRCRGATGSAFATNAYVLPTAFRWLSGQDKPSVVSCQRLAEYSGMPINKILSAAGYMPDIKGAAPEEWPEFRDYARLKYGNELDEDLIIMIEDLIERKREKRNVRKKVGSHKNS